MAGGLPPPPDPRDAAAAAGMPGARDGEVTLLTAAHSVYRVEAGGTAVIVKLASPESLAQGRGLAAEAFAYRLAGWRPELAAVMPSALLVDEQRHVIVLAAQPQQATARHLLAQGWLPDDDAWRALGGTLARVHRATAGVPMLIPTSAGILELPRTPPEHIWLDRARGLAMEVASDDVIAPGLTAAREAWEPSCLVHGDVKWDNCLITLQPPDPPTVMLIDWELSGVGDPAWDVAAAMAAGRSMALGADGSAEPGHLALMAGYLDGGGVLDSGRLAAYWPSRMVHLAMELAEAGATPAAHALLEQARALFADPEASTAMIAQWLQRCPRRSART